jgi:hypothetical protein
MRRRWVLAIVLATAITFALVGTAIGYWVVPDPKGESAQCVVLSNDLKKLTYLSTGGTSGKSVVDAYNSQCR